MKIKVEVFKSQEELDAGSSCKTFTVDLESSYSYLTPTNGFKDEFRKKADDKLIEELPINFPNLEATSQNWNFSKTSFSLTLNFSGRYVMLESDADGQMIPKADKTVPDKIFFLQCEIIG
ncbi:MAG: hypothetical protein IJR99_11520 [Kiritimatiellae bacterium]|nr:hypothetical protein [Kiritimatiellia bacterium]